MKNIWTIAWKDTLIRLRDRNALIFTIIAPIIIAAIMGFAFGGGSGNAVEDIPLIVVNADEGPFGAEISTALETPELAALLEPTAMDDLAAAQRVVESGAARAVIYIPPEFSATLSSSNSGEPTAQSAVINLYSDAAARITPLIIESIVQQISVRLGAVSMVAPLVLSEVQTDPEAQIAQLEPALNNALAQAPDARFQAIQIEDTVLEANRNSNPFAFFAPSLAIFFLLFSMLDGPRTIFTEQANGTFARLLTTPATIHQVLLGKFIGTFLTGSIQFAILVVATYLMFGLDWGNSILGLILLAFTFIAAAASIGAIIIAISKDNTQASLLGSVVPIIFGALGGNFFSLEGLPEWLQNLSYVSINRWAVLGFSDLTVRQLGFDAVLLESGVLFAIAIGCFFIAAWRLPRRFAR